MAAPGQLLVDQIRIGGARGCPAKAANRVNVPRSAGGATASNRRGEYAARVVSVGNMPAAACTVGQHGQLSCWHGGGVPSSWESRSPKSGVQRTAAFPSSKFARASPEPVAAVVKTVECETVGARAGAARAPAIVRGKQEGRGDSGRRASSLSRRFAIKPDGGEAGNGRAHLLHLRNGTNDDVIEIASVFMVSQGRSLMMRVWRRQTLRLRRPVTLAQQGTDRRRALPDDDFDILRVMALMDLPRLRRMRLANRNR